MDKRTDQEGICAKSQQTRHYLEDLLARNYVRKFLSWLTAGDGNSQSRFECISENYNNPELRGWQRVKWFLPQLAIDIALKKAKLDKQVMTEKLFHHEPTVRALTLTARSIAHYGLSSPQRYVAPLMVVWNFTQACNLRCKHCYQSALAKPLANELTLEEKLRVVDEMGAAGVPCLAIAGGEPLLSPHLWPVLERARKRRIHLSLATNGTMLTPETVQRLIDSGVKYIEISIDSLDPATHDRFRGQPGAWAKSIQGIKNCVAAGMRTGLATCFTRDTVETAEDVIEFAISLGCRTFSHFNFIPVGRGKDMADSDLTPTQRERLLKKLVAYMQERRITVISTAPQLARACLQYAPPDGIFATGHAGVGQGGKAQVLTRYVGGCGAGRCYCAIEPNGDVTPCVYMPSLVVGNLRKAQFGEIWNNSLFEKLSDRNHSSGHCPTCDYRAYCGGCRARAYSYTGDVLAADPGCGYNAEIWEAVASQSSLVNLASAGEG